MTKKSLNIASHFALWLVLQWVSYRFLAQAFSLSGSFSRARSRLDLSKSDRSNMAESTARQQLVNGEATEQEESQPGLVVNHTTTTTRFVTPYQILYPDSFPAWDEEVTGYDRALGLNGALRLLVQAVQRLASDKVDSEIMQSLIHDSSIMRLEHVVADSSIDPLAWLHAQARDQATFYLANQEGTLEVACLGAAMTIHSTAQLWNVSLPQHAHWYGGERFDSTRSGSAAMADEWKAFGSAFWMLPLVELRQSQGTCTLAVHLALDTEHDTWTRAAAAALPLLETVTDQCRPRVPPTTLPPVLVREYQNQDGPELYEQAVAQALRALQGNETDAPPLQKVVLARLQTMHLGARLTALDVLRRWKYGGHEGGHLFYLRPAQNAPEFFGCTPERLFQVEDGHVRSEALAGTRPRGSTQEADQQLLQELVASPKDVNENRLTGDYIVDAFHEVAQQGWTEPLNGGEYFVRRLLHLQHICRRYSAKLINGETMNVTRQLLSRMHPTPAVCGLPLEESRDFIRQYESFDRGFYAGPIGYIGRDKADIFVAIRSGLVTASKSKNGASVSIYAGSGLVPGSTFQGEFAETNYKFAVISSLFPPSPFTLQSAPNANVAWAAAFVEELIRNGVTKFFVCPGSRSTPLVVAIARAARTHVGVVHAVSVHDERATGFRAVGYARGSGRPAAVITSSGTAVANLYPAIVEAGMDGVPMLLLTADRPYESRDTGANQAIDQVKVFSDTYIRWFRDILPPSDDVPVSVALSDANHAVSVSRQLRGPVHVNIQFRENLAPDAGPIRNDDRVGSFTKHDGSRFTDSAAFKRWSTGGGTWTKSYALLDSMPSSESVTDVAELIEQSTRGIIVVGNLRLSTSENERDDQTTLSQLISDFAQAIGFPIFAGVQSGSLRFSSHAVVPFAEHILKCSIVSENLKPDLVIQIGAPLISTELPSVIESALKHNSAAAHVLIQPHYGKERADPGFTVSHTIRSEIGPFLKALSRNLNDRGTLANCHSELAPIILLGRRLQTEMKNIIREASDSVSIGKPGDVLTEPEVALAVSAVFSQEQDNNALFLSNSMPIRDAEFFLYPFTRELSDRTGPRATASNRGASGIDGILSSAMGFAEATQLPTTLLVGDLSAMHDLNSMHALGSDLQNSSQGTSKKKTALTTVIVNNDGGGIFSFLPIAKHGADVSFEDFFGTPTNSFSFSSGASAFGLPFRRASDYSSFLEAYEESLRGTKDGIVEAVVVGRDENVAVHRRITDTVASLVAGLLSDNRVEDGSEKLPIKTYYSSPSLPNSKTMILLHGWMGDKTEWDGVGSLLANNLDEQWTVISVDLPGHGAWVRRKASELAMIKKALALEMEPPDDDLNVGAKAKAILESLMDDYGVETIDAICGYSLGARVALEMKRQTKTSSDKRFERLLPDDSAMILIGGSPGDLMVDNSETKDSLDREMHERCQFDDNIAARIDRISMKSSTVKASSSESRFAWDSFLNNWYGNSIWGSLKSKRIPYTKMTAKRATSLSGRGRDLAASISQCSPPRNRDDNWKLCSPERTLFLAGGGDPKYSLLGQSWARRAGICYKELLDAGHALLVESPEDVANSIVDFVTAEASCPAVESISTSEEVPEHLDDLEPSEKEDVDLSISSAASTPAGNAAHRTSDALITIEALDFVAFSIDIADDTKKNGRVYGIGWGENAEARESSVVPKRSGFIVQIDSNDGREVGLGEVSPLAGLHAEKVDEAKEQLEHLKTWIENGLETDVLVVSSEAVLALDGELGEFVDRMASMSGIVAILPSVRSGIEMALLSLASQRTSTPIHQALLRAANLDGKSPASPTHLPVNGLITRGGSTLIRSLTSKSQSFPTLKVKVGHQNLDEDATAVLDAFQRMDILGGRPRGRIRADANRAWDEGRAMEFASSLDGLDVHAVDRIEFVEEPLNKSQDNDGKWSFDQQIASLERWYMHTAIPFALDESIADLTELNHGKFELIKEDLKLAFQSGPRGCACFVLKPALLGMELSMRIARFARKELGIGAVFSSSFDSGIGLAHAAFLGFLSDQVGSTAPTFPHGVGTYSMLEADTLTPPFASYVNEAGFLNLPSLSRALYGLGLEELRGSLESYTLTSVGDSTLDNKTESYEATTATSSTGREISVVVSFPLPFSADIACSRFTDLPQQSRWSPWISSVAYQGTESEWTMNVRGIPLKWRASSRLLSDPFPGIEWQSVSGLKNRGSVEFVPDSPSSCHMNVRMTIVPPRLLRPLFQGTSVFIEDFLRDKLIKWSLEMFRDVVKADLALERGDVELGDALFGAVEGKASAIEASLENIPPATPEDTKS